MLELVKHHISENEFLAQPVTAFYHVDYLSYHSPNNPNFLNTLKNTFNTISEDILSSAYEVAYNYIFNALVNLIEYCDSEPLVMHVPRSKADTTYKDQQLLFEKAVSDAAQALDIEDGTMYITRISNTYTTRMKKAKKYNNDGPTPYPGITHDTCMIADSFIKDRVIILVDDVYTYTVNVDEDCIQALLDLGAKEVILYTVARTLSPEERRRALQKYNERTIPQSKDDLPF